MCVCVCNQTPPPTLATRATTGGRGRTKEDRDPRPDRDVAPVPTPPAVEQRAVGRRRERGARDPATAAGNPRRARFHPSLPPAGGVRLLRISPQPPCHSERREKAPPEATEGKGNRHRPSPAGVRETGAADPTTDRPRSGKAFRPAGRTERRGGPLARLAPGGRGPRIHDTRSNERTTGKTRPDRRTPRRDRDKSLCQGLTFNRSQRGSCSATHETPTQKQVVYE